jgi:hydroxymethylbilane synthase
MDGVPIRLGTRGSSLALVQARWVEAALVAAGVAVDLVRITTAGDVRSPDTAWGEGAFVTAIESALLEGHIDAAVHSAKDVPTVEDPRLAIAAFTVREDPRDALVCRVRGRTLATLPHGARIGTDSPRRTAFLHAIRPDLAIHPLSGNVDTRLRKLEAGESDALVLAVAGLSRLGHADRIDQILPLDVAVPAPGQGALALQVRADDERARAALGRLDDPATRAAVEAERWFLRATGGGCRSPIGCLAVVEGGQLILMAAARRGSDRDGRPSIVRAEARGDAADRLAIAEGLARRVVEARRPRVLVTRAPGQADPLVEVLQQRGLEAVVVPAIEVRPVPPGGDLDDRIAALERYDWVVVTSVNGAAAVLAALERGSRGRSEVRWAAVGRGTEAALRAGGIETDFVPSRHTGAALGAELPVGAGARVLLPRGDLADDALPAALGGRGAIVDAVVAYRTVEGPEGSRAALAAALDDGSTDALVFASGSAVRGLLELAPAGLAAVLRATPAICIGPATTEVARGLGFARITEASSQDADGLADAVVAALSADADLVPEPSAVTSMTTGATGAADASTKVIP